MDPNAHYTHSGPVLLGGCRRLLGGDVGGNAGLEVSGQFAVGLDPAFGLGLAVGLVAPLTAGLGATIGLAVNRATLVLGRGRGVRGSDHGARQSVFGLATDVDAMVGRLVLVERGLLLNDRVERELIQNLQMTVQDLALELIPQILAHLRIAHDVGRHGTLEHRFVNRVPVYLSLLGTEVEHLQETVPEVEHHPVPEEQERVLGLEDLDLQLALLAGVDGHRRGPFSGRHAIVDDLRHEAGNHGDDLPVFDVTVDSGFLAIGIECHRFVVQAELPRLLLHLGQKFTHDSLHEHSENTVQFHLNLLVFYFPWLFGATRINTTATSKKLGRFSSVVATSQRYQPHNTPETINKNSLILNFI